MSRELRKIVFIISSLGSGGAERVVCSLANELTERGYQIEIILVANGHMAYNLSDKVKLVCLSCEERHMGLNGLQRTFKRIAEIRKAIKQSRADVAVSFMSDTNIDVCFAACGLKTKVIVSERNDPAIDPASRMKRILRKIAYCRGNGFVFQTPDAQAYFSHRIQKHSCIILNPLTSELPIPYEGDREKRIVAVGRLTKQKNYPMLFGAFSEFIRTKPEYILEIYGEGPLENDLQADLRRKNLHNRVVLKGFCKDVHQQIRTAAFFVMTSDFEGMPNALIEAMALGLPCISTDCPCGGPRMLIHHGENGLLIPVKDQQALVNAMYQMAHDPKAAAQMGRNACRIKEQVQLDTITDQWLCYIMKICGKQAI